MSIGGSLEGNHCNDSINARHEIYLALGGEIPFSNHYSFLLRSDRSIGEEIADDLRYCL